MALFVAAEGDCWLVCGLGSSEDDEGDEDAGGGVVGVLSGKCACQCRGIGEGSSVVTEQPIVVVIVVAVDSENRRRDKEKRLSNSAKIKRKELIVE